MRTSREIPIETTKSSTMDEPTETTLKSSIIRTKYNWYFNSGLEVNTTECPFIIFDGFFIIKSLLGNCKTSDIKRIKDKKGFWVANVTECLTDTMEKFKHQCIVEYYCRNNQSLPVPKTIRCENGYWYPAETPKCKTTKS